MIRNPGIKFLLLLCLTPLLVNSTSAAEVEWTYKGEKHEVQLYWRDFANSSIPEFKATTKINASMASVLAVLLDIEACPQWVHQCKRAFVVQQLASNHQIIYQVNSVPFAKDRDVVMAAELNFINDAETITIDLTNASDFCETASVNSCDTIRDSKYFRITSLEGTWRLQQLGSDTVEATWQQHLELGGNLPSWIVRSKLDDLAFQSMDGLRQQSKKAQYQGMKINIDNNELFLVSDH